MSQFSYQCPRCEFAVPAESHHSVCAQCGLVVAAGTAPTSASKGQSLVQALAYARPQLITWCSCSGTGLAAALALRSSALESNVTLGTLAVMGVAWCAPGALRQWNARFQQS